MKRTNATVILTRGDEQRLRGYEGHQRRHRDGRRHDGGTERARSLHPSLYRGDPRRTRDGRRHARVDDERPSRDERPQRGDVPRELQRRLMIHDEPAPRVSVTG